MEKFAYMISSCLLVICVLIQAPLWAQETDIGINSQVQKAFTLYEEGSIAEAENLAYRLLSEESELTTRQKHELYRLLAFCAIANGDEDAGLRLFVNALRYNPAMTPDPLTWSPKVRRVYENALESYEQQIAEEKKQRLSSIAEMCRRASSRSLVFPGAGQYMKGEKNKGYLLGSLFWTSLGSFIYTQIQLPQVRDDYRNANTTALAEARYDDYRNMQYMVNITGLITITVYGYSFFDALWAVPPDYQNTDVE